MKSRPIQQPLKPRKNLEIQFRSGAQIDDVGSNVARLAASPAVAAQRIIGVCEGRSSFGELLDVPTLTAHLDELSDQVKAGDLDRIEEMLVCQATALQSLFTRMIEKAMNADSMGIFNDFMKIGLRAQNQSRMTLETLATVKNPPMVFAKQMNLAHNQQINNGVPAHQEHRIQQSKVLEKTDGQRMDAGEKEATGGTDSDLEAVGAVDRPQKQRRQSYRREEPIQG